MRRNWIWTPVALVVLAAVSYGIYRQLQADPLPPGIIYGNGHIEAVEIRVASEVAGRVVESRVVEGTTVAFGDLLVRIDDRDIRLRLAQAEAEKVAIEREIARLNDQLAPTLHHIETAKADAARYGDLLKRGAVPPQRLEQVENTYQEAQARLTSIHGSLAEAAARLEAAQRGVELLEVQIAKAAVRAPIAGTIVVKGVESGEFAAVGQTVAVLVDLDRLELKLFVPERDLGKIKLRDPARVRVDAFPDRFASAHVMRIDQRAQFTPRDIHMPEERVRMVFGVTLAIDNPRRELKPGMPADAWVLWQQGAQWPARLVVPD